MAEGNGLEVSVGPAKVSATGDRSMQAAFFIVIVAVFVGGFSVMWNDHTNIRTSIDRLTIATITSDEDKKSAIGSSLREDLKDEIRKTAEQVVKKGKGE